MQPTDSQGRTKSTALVAGLGAALVASALTLAMMVSNASPAMPAQAAPPTNQCQAVPLMILVSTTKGGGTVRFREGSSLSPPITLSAGPQTVVFPRPRPIVGQLEEVITIEGDATDVVTTSPITQARNVYPRVSGILAIDAKWRPLKPC
jgi:hypothetical protein